MKRTVIVKKSLGEKIIEILQAYIKTQLIVVALVSIVSWILLSLLHIPYAWLLAFFTGALSVIPVLGMITAAIITSFVSVFDGVRFLPNLPEIFEGVTVLILFGLLNFGIDFFLAPFIVGKYTKIHPLLLVLFIVVGTVTFGFFGALLAVPAFLVAKTVFDHLQETKS